MICYHKKILHCFIDYVPHTVHFIAVTHLFCNLRFVPLNLPHLLISSPQPSPPSLW